MQNSQFDAVACLVGHVARNTMMGCFDVVIQPFINIQTRECVGGEVLVRGYCRGKPVCPNSFIPALEQNNTILYLDLFVLSRGVAFARLNQLFERDNFTLSFNFSPGEFNQPDFSAKVQANVLPSEAKNIILEITETDIIINDVGLRHIRQLQDYGFSVTWDDIFSLQTARANLRQFPCRLLKLDRSMMHAENLARAGELIDYCQRNEVELIVEGVETAAQLQWLVEKNVRLVQGYYFSPPVAKHVFIERYLPSREDAAVE